ALTKRGVEPLDVGGIDDPIALRAASERLHACRRAIDTAALGLDHTPSLVELDDLGDQDMAPRTKPCPPALACVHGIAKGLPNGPSHIVVVCRIMGHLHLLIPPGRILPELCLKPC